MHNIITVILLVGIFVSYGCQPSCENELIGSYPSPNGEMAAVTFSRNCGATTGSNLQISVIKKGQSYTDAGNVLIMDQVSIDVNIYKPIWKDNNLLLLEIPEGARVFSQNHEVASVRIDYR